jgi:hypothetical protein
MDIEEYTMRELTDLELDEVAGGNPFRSFALAAVAQALDGQAAAPHGHHGHHGSLHGAAVVNIDFNIGQVVGVNMGGVNRGTIFG